MLFFFSGKAAWEKDPERMLEFARQASECPCCSY
jgi:hypothetical protein